MRWVPVTREGSQLSSSPVSDKCLSIDFSPLLGVTPAIVGGMILDSPCSVSLQPRQVYDVWQVELVRARAAP